MYMQVRVMQQFTYKESSFLHSILRLKNTRFYPVLLHGFFAAEQLATYLIPILMHPDVKRAANPKFELTAFPITEGITSKVKVFRRKDLRTPWCADIEVLFRHNQQQAYNVDLGYIQFLWSYKPGAQYDRNYPLPPRGTVDLLLNRGEALCVPKQWITLKEFIEARSHGQMISPAQHEFWMLQSVSL